MGKGGGRARFAFETGQPDRVGGHGVGQHLDRDVAAELVVARPIDLAHAAGPERADHFEASEAHSDGERHPSLDTARMPS